MAARTTRMSRSRAIPLYARTGRVPQAATSEAIIDDCQRGRLRQLASLLADSVKWFVFGGAR